MQEQSYGQEQQQACPSVHHQTELCPLVINRRWPCGHHTKIEILSSVRQGEKVRKGLTVSESISGLAGYIQRVAAGFLLIDYKAFIHPLNIFWVLFRSQAMCKPLWIQRIISFFSNSLKGQRSKQIIIIQ